MHKSSTQPTCHQGNCVKPATRRASENHDQLKLRLADAGDTRLVTDLLDAVLYRGNGATAQRSEYQRRGRLMDVITAAATTTTG